MAEEPNFLLLPYTMREKTRKSIPSCLRFIIVDLLNLVNSPKVTEAFYKPYIYVILYGTRGSRTPDLLLRRQLLYPVEL